MLTKTSDLLLNMPNVMDRNGLERALKALSQDTIRLTIVAVMIDVT